MTERSILSALRLLRTHTLRRDGCDYIRVGRGRVEFASFIVPELRRRGLLDERGKLTKRGEEEAR